MENMIKKIVEADDEAKVMKNKTLQEKENLEKEIELESKKIYEKYMSAAEQTVKRNNLQEEKKAEQEWSAIQKQQKSVLIKLKSDYELNCEKWVDQIVERSIV